MHPIRHFRTITHHRHLVRKYCFRVGLYWRGLTHDLSKYSPTEFWRGAKYYQGTFSPTQQERRENGYSLAWMHHKGRNRHHFEYWTDVSPVTHQYEPLEMPTEFFVEMCMDRIAASRTYLGDQYHDGAPLEYLETDVQMQCEICRKKELAKTRCVNGHYVCSDCHMQGLDSIVELCLRETACDPIAIVERMMALPSCHMHGPEHHVMVGAALLTAYHNAGGDIALSDALMEMLRRGKSVPGGACGFWGACGAGISTGMFVSIISGSTPLTDEPFALSHKMTAAALGQIGEIGGPRCCKRDSFLSILTAIDFVKEHFGIALQKPEVVCRYAAQNNQCIGKRCPFSAANRTAK